MQCAVESFSSFYIIPHLEKNPGQYKQPPRMIRTYSEINDCRFISHNQLCICSSKKICHISKDLICAERFCDGESWRASYASLSDIFKLINCYDELFFLRV